MATQNNRKMKESLLKLLEKLLDRGHYVCIATHDVEYIAKARAILAERKVPKDRYEFQMLVGVPREKLLRELVESGETVRLYVPFAVHWDDAIALSSPAHAREPPHGRPRPQEPGRQEQLNPGRKTLPTSRRTQSRVSPSLPLPEGWWGVG